MFYIQHGYGKSQKIHAVVADGHVSGVILSPGHEDAATLESTAAACQNAGLDVLVDPQSYIYSTKPQGALRFHARNGVELTSMHWSAAATSVLAHLSSIEAMAARVGARRRIIAPAPYHSTLADYWMPAGLQYARTAQSQWSGSEVFASIVISQDALSDWATVQDWLDAATLLDVHGFYLIVGRTGSPYPPFPWNPRNLANLLRVIHTLSVINGYEVIWGYADIDGLLGLAAGANGIASGWSYSLRQFSIDRYFQERSGGAQPVPRILIPELLSTLRTSEVADIMEIAVEGALNSLDGRSPEQIAELGNPEAQVAHLIQLARLADAVSALPLDRRLGVVREWIVSALQRLHDLAGQHVTIEARHVARLRSYAEALELFDREATR